MCVWGVCVCVRERERGERDGVLVCVCVRERERWSLSVCVGGCVRVCVCVCVRVCVCVSRGPLWRM